ncbi:TPA: DUF4102 domain-containing protein [Klebsiella variicola]|nr:DUF4102 domain-containing protein [Klebsiella variicola subsp. variicola]HDS5938641.1 DUF4102 domain-containing protein [Klebsiella variicola]HDS5949516.1 DUF4102 domain-containing protein [Klebsiella variicola]HDT2761202.1 DUF4102 domain-containing protein [Klebsiella variicola]
MKLTARQVETSKAKDKPYKLSDGGGLYLLVNPNGARYWRLKYRVAGKEKSLALGVYPEVSLADARQKRAEAKKVLAAVGAIQYQLLILLLLFRTGHHFPYPVTWLCYCG